VRGVVRAPRRALALALACLAPGLAWAQPALERGYDPDAEDLDGGEPTIEAHGAPAPPHRADAGPHLDGVPREVPRAPTIDLYTLGLGEEWVERWGHSAICVSWPDHRRDRCYNYGTTSFTELGAMVWGFLRGRSIFWVSTSRPQRMIDSYRRYDRTIERQRLPLTPDQARELAAALAHDARRENRYYHYHHYKDNCTTRLRDFVERYSAGALGRGATGRYPTLRELSRAGWAEIPLLLYLSDVLIGREIDRTPTPYEAMFLPLVLRDQVERVLGVAPEVIYARRGPPIGTSPSGRWPLFALFALLALPVVAARRAGRFERLALAWALIPSLVLAVLIWGIVLVSPVPELRWNELALVFLPTDLLLVVGPRGLRRRYALGRALELGALSIGAALGVLRQPIEPFVLIALVAIVAVMIPRASDRAPSPAGDA
jgi:hypothetical protein